MKNLKKIISILTILLVLVCSLFHNTTTNYALNSGNYTIKFVSMDTSNYPRIRVYYKIYDENGEVVNNFKIQTVKIREKIAGGEYLNREVRGYEILSDNEGLATSLVVDRSTSLNADDLSKIKNVLNEFLESMDFNIGDSAEIISFGTDIITHVSFTADKNKLSKGINEIELKGKTALYDALYRGIDHAKVQKGARCVIGFTDGHNNEGKHREVSYVIDHANDSQVPVYIVSVGNDIDETSLQKLARETGGRYWNIDDLQDFFEVLKEIYIAEKSTYYFEYITDIPIEETRNVEITLDDGKDSITSIDEVKPIIIDDPTDDFERSILEEKPQPDSWYKTIAGFWYYIENDGKTTKKGWFKDGRDDQTYYLDKNTGIMAVGWTQIDGALYYFNESHINEPNWYEVGNGFYESYGKKVKAYGSMYRNEVTPDGKRVDADGKLIVDSSNAGDLSNQLKKVKVISNYSSSTKIDEIDTVKFGSYLQTANYEPIEWIVLEKDESNHRVLLLSKYILDCKKYNETRNGVYWKTSTIRQWLNSYFYNLAFDNIEKNMIRSTTVTTSQNSVYNTKGGDSSVDKVFLLSMDECLKYFGNGTQNGHYYNVGNIVITRGTQYAKSVNNSNGALKVDGDGNSPYWLRSTGVEIYDAADVKEDGNVDAEGYFVDRNIIGIRPAIWVNY